MKDIRNSSAHIFEIQKRLFLLRKSGIAIPLVIPDGIYGENTRDAVKAFSVYAGLSERDYVDLEVWKALSKIYRITYP